MPDFTTYQPPGVYIEEDPSPLVSVIGVPPTVVGIVGPSVGYRENTEAITLTGTAPVTLEKLGINPTTGFVVAALDGTVYAGSAYTVTPGAGADSNIGATLDNTATLARSGAGSAIPDGATVFVRYRYTDADYATPLLVQDYDDVKDAFGDPLDITTGTIISPLSLAAKVALENGAFQVVLVPTTGSASTTTRAELQTALNKLNARQDVNVIVTLPVGITGTPSAVGDVINVVNDLRLHLETAATNGVYKVGVAGFEKTVTVDPLTAVASFRSERIMFAWPNRMSYYNGYTNTTIELAGYYLAAAYAGRMAAQPVQVPLTKKQIRGFAGIPAVVLAEMTTSTKNSWSEAGIAVTEQDRQGRLIVRHGTSTDRSTVTKREMSLVRARDALVNLIYETTTAAELIGTATDEETPLRVKGVVSGALEMAVSTDIIVRYDNLKVRQRSLDPTVIEVKFQYLPAYPLNYIVISFAVNALTGETTPIETIEAA